jgi:hypothetical protein
MWGSDYGLKRRWGEEGKRGRGEEGKGGGEGKGWRGDGGVSGILNWYSFGSQKWYRFSCHFVLHSVAVTSHYYGFCVVKQFVRNCDCFIWSPDVVIYSLNDINSQIAKAIPSNLQTIKIRSKAFSPMCLFVHWFIYYIFKMITISLWLFHDNSDQYYRGRLIYLGSNNL